MVLCFQGKVINVTISHIKLPPRNVPPTFYKLVYVVLKEKGGFVQLEWYRWPKFLLLAHLLKPKITKTICGVHSSRPYIYRFILSSNCLELCSVTFQMFSENPYNVCEVFRQTDTRCYCSYHKYHKEDSQRWSVWLLMIFGVKKQISTLAAYGIANTFLHKKNNV